MIQRRRQMKYIKQFTIIILISFLGELLRAILPLPIPASIYGIILLFLSLQFHIISISSIKETSMFLIEIMPVLFIPAAVGLLNSWSLIKASWIPYLVITVVSTLTVMVVSGHVTQWIIKLQQKDKEVSYERDL